MKFVDEVKLLISRGEIKEASLNILNRFGEGFILLVSVKADGTSTIISNTSNLPNSLQGAVVL